MWSSHILCVFTLGVLHFFHLFSLVLNVYKLGGTRHETPFLCTLQDVYQLGVM